MLSSDDMVIVLQRYVNTFQADLRAIHTALGDPSTPEAAQRYLIGALNYAFDMLDIYPDHNKGIGIADDAIVLRLAAKLARAAGATSPDVDRLATDANTVSMVFEDLAGPLEKLVEQMPDREVRGRTAAKILSHKDTRVMFDADVSREAKKHTPHELASGEAGARAVIELRKMIEHALKRAKLL